MKNIIEIKDLNFSYQKEYQRVDVFENLNLDIEEGGIITIFGESGSGKSSILNLIAGYLKPQRGSIIVAGSEVNKFNEVQACKYRNGSIGFIHQAFNLLPKLSAKENIMLPSIIAGEKVTSAEKRAKELMEYLKIDHRDNHFPYQMSGGEQQRIAIARALTNNPDVILADEPTGNLDAKNSEIVKKLLKKIADDGKTILIVTHDPCFKEISKRVIDIHELTKSTIC